MQPEPYARPFWLNQNYATITVSFVSGYVEGLGETKLTVYVLRIHYSNRWLSRIIAGLLCMPG